MHTMCLSIYLSIYISIYLSIYIYIYLSRCESGYGYPSPSLTWFGPPRPDLNNTQHNSLKVFQVNISFFISSIATLYLTMTVRSSVLKRNYLARHLKIDRQTDKRNRQPNRQPKKQINKHICIYNQTDSLIFRQKDKDTDR